MTRVATPRTASRALRPVLAGLMLAMLLAALDHTIVATALPTIVGELGDLAQLPWVVVAYMLAATVSVPVIGRVSDLIGRTKVFQAAIALFVLGALASGAAQNLPWLIVARVAQGTGAGGIIALTHTTIADLVSPRERGRYHGLLGAVFGFASVAGPLLGGLFVDHLSWRLVFWLNVPLGLLALVILRRLLRLAPVVGPRRVDWLGGMLLAAGVTGLLFWVAWGGRTGAWTEPVMLTLVGASVVLLVVFVWWQSRTAEPIVPLSLFGNRTFAISAAVGFVVGIGMFGTIIYMPLFLQAVLGASATASGLLLLPLLSGFIASTVISGRLVARWGRYRVFPIAGTTLLALGVWLLSHLDPGTTPLQTTLPLATTGIGLGMVMQIIVLAVQNAVDSTHLGSATSLTQFFRTIGGTVGVAVFGALLNARVGASLGEALPGGAVRELLASPAAIAGLDPATRDIVRLALSEGLTGLYAAAVPVILVGVVLAFCLPELPLRTSVRTDDRS